MDFWVSNVRHGVQTRSDRHEVSIRPLYLHTTVPGSHSIPATHQNLSPFRKGPSSHFTDVTATMIEDQFSWIWGCQMSDMEFKLGWIDTY